MLQEKNSKIITDLCRVFIRSSYHNDVIPAFQEIYGTPSEINYSRNARITVAGVIYNSVLTLQYPGLKGTDFKDINAMLHDAYKVIVQYNDDSRYQIADFDSEMQLTTTYDDEQGHALRFTSTNIYVPRELQPQETGDINAPLTGNFQYDFAIQLH